VLLLRGTTAVMLLLVSRGGRVERRVADDDDVAVEEEEGVVVVNEENKGGGGVLLGGAGGDDARGLAVTLSMLRPSSDKSPRCRRCAVVVDVGFAVGDDDAAAGVADDAVAAALPVGASSVLVSFFELAKDFTDAGLDEDDEVLVAELPEVLPLSFLFLPRMVMTRRCGVEDDAVDAAVASSKGAAAVVEKDRASSSSLPTSLPFPFRCCCGVAAVASSASRDERGVTP
jgi:hypothetical protein